MHKISKNKEQLGREIKSSKKTIAELEEVNQKYFRLSELLDNVSESVHASDKDLILNYWNKASERMYGWKAEEVMGKYTHDIFQSEYLGIERDKVLKLVKEKRFFTGEVMRRRKDGSYIQVEFKVQALYDNKGELTGFVAIDRDITERKKLEQELKSSEEKYRTLIENVAEIILVAQDGLIKFINTTATNITGYTRDEVLFQPFINFIHPDDRKMVAERYQRSIRGEDVVPSPYFFRNVDKNGNTRWVQIRAVLIEWEGRPATLNFLTDITDQVLAREELEYRIKLIQIINSISTRFINLPLADIDSGISDALERIGEFTKADRCYVFQISDDGNTMSNTFEWCAVGIEPQIGSLQNVSVADHKWAFEKYRRFEVVHIPRTGDLPAEAGALKEELERENIKSCLAVPMVYSGNILLGFFGLDSVRRERVWTDEEIALLQIVSEILANALERKRTEEILKESEEKFRKLFNSAVDLMFLTELAEDGLPGKILEVNEVVCNSLGYSRDELLQMNRLDLCSPVERQKMISSIRPVLLEKGHVVYETELLRKDNSILPVESNVTMFDWKGKRATLSVIRNLTERRKAEEELRKSERRFESLVESTNLGIVSIDLNTNINYVNNAVCQMLGYSRNELVGKEFIYFLKTDDIERVSRLFLSSFRLPMDSIELEFKAIHKNGHILDIQVSVSRIKDGDNTIGFIAIMSDVTEHNRILRERKEIERKAQLNSRLAAIGEMAAGIAHEINNPLTAVIGYAQLLMECDISSQVKEDLVKISEGARRVSEIVRRLLLFARQQKPYRDYVSINDIISTTLKLQEYILEKNNIKVNLNLDPLLPLTVADAGQLQQVFLNIIINAQTEMKLAHNGGNLWIKTEKNDDKIMISFRDDGPGIKKENLDRIFEPFFTTRETGKGTGLGLSVCHGIISEHNGRIWAESEEGKGAEFIIELPIVTVKEVQEEYKKTSEKPAIDKATILVIDDDPVITEFITRVLTGEGHSIEVVNDAEEAIKLIEKKRYRLILLDIKMPKMSGMELYTRIRQVAESLAHRVIFMTGDVMNLDTENFLSETKATYISKPFDAPALKDKIAKVLSTTSF